LRQFPVGHRELAWILATCPDAKFRDAKAALDSVARAGKLSEKNIWKNDLARAAALADMGQFDKASELVAQIRYAAGLVKETPAKSSARDSCIAERKNTSGRPGRRRSNPMRTSTNRLPATRSDTLRRVRFCEAGLQAGPSRSTEYTPPLH
jgi:hypothetical protein